MTIYVLNNKYYVQSGTQYEEMLLIVNNNSISFNSTGEYIDSIEGAKETTFAEIQKKMRELG